MRLSMFTYVELYDRILDSLAHVLKKGAAFAQSRGDSSDAILDWRLIEDMQPLRFQAMVVTNFARQWPARTAGLDVPEAIPDSLSLEGFMAAIADAKAILAALKPEQFAGRDDVPITYKLDAIEPVLPAGQWLSVFASTNIYFHLSIAYAILRMKGAPLGKPDLFGGRL